MEKILKFNEFINENDSNEVSIDKVLSSSEKKQFKIAFENTDTGIDSISFKKDGTIVAKRGYFYRHGATPESVAEKMKMALLKNGINIAIVDAYDDFKPWPKDSNFIIIFKVL